MIGDIQIIAKVYLISLAWQVLAWPFLRIFFKKLPDRGWALGRVSFTLICSLVVWNLGHLGLTVNTNGFLLAVTAVISAVSVLIYKKTHPLKLSDSRLAWKFIAMEEYLFLVGLFLLSITRGFEPSIRSLEKFMDFGFVYRYLSSPNLPAEDMWMAGQSINYYSFGHFWASIVIRFFSVDPAIGYNLVLALIFGLSLSLSFAVAAYLHKGSESSKMISGLVAAFAVCVGGNTHAIWYFARHLNFSGYWYADATRFIHNTIHEFPSYSFVVSDLHGHLLDLPFVLAFILIALIWYREGGRTVEIGMGILFGVMSMTNTWDVAVYGLLLLILFLTSMARRNRSVFGVVISGLIMLLSALAVAIPWSIGFVPISKGVALVSERTPAWQIGVLWAGGISSAIMAIIVSKKGDQKALVFAIAIAAVALLVIPEVVYAKDIYPNHPRANTMFKLTYQAFILFGLLMGTAFGGAIDEWRKHMILKSAVLSVCSILLVSVLTFPIMSFNSYYADFKTYKGLNGEAWMLSIIPEKYGAIKYLRSHRNGKNLIEAVGDSYTDLNAVSAFSGVPTVCGWRVHEWLWRGGYGPVDERDKIVKQVYESDSAEKVLSLLEEYRVGWILVGRDERLKYAVNEKSLLGAGKVVWEMDDTYLIEVGH